MSMPPDAPEPGAYTHSEPPRGSSAAGAIAVILIIGGVLALLVCGGLAAFGLLAYRMGAVQVQATVAEEQAQRLRAQAEFDRAEAEIDRARAKVEAIAPDQATAPTINQAVLAAALAGQWSSADTGLTYTITIDVADPRPTLTAVADQTGAAWVVERSEWDGARLTVRYSEVASGRAWEETLQPDAANPAGRLTGSYTATDAAGIETTGTSTWTRGE